MAVLLNGCIFGHKTRGNGKNVSATDSTGVKNAVDSAVVIQRQDSSARVDTAASVAASDPQLLAALTPVWSRHITWNTFAGKAKVHYSGKGDQQDFSANIRMEAGRKVWVSITALGLFEVARALITPDTIIVIDRIHKEVRILPFSEAGKVLPVAVDFPTLQQLLIGDVLRNNVTPATASAIAGMFNLAVTTPQYQQDADYNKADTTLARQDIKTGGVPGALLHIQYSDYSVQDGRRFAGNRVIDVVDKGEPYHAELDFGNVTFDGTPDFSFSVPAKYTRK